MKVKQKKYIFCNTYIFIYNENINDRNFNRIERVLYNDNYNNKNKDVL